MGGRSQSIVRYALKYKVLVLMTIIVITFIIGARAFLLHYSRVSEIAHSKVSAKNNSTVLDQNIRTVFSKVDLSLRSISKFSNSYLVQRKPNIVETLKILDFYQASLPEVHAFRFADENGNVLVNTDRNVPTNVSIDDREYFQYHKVNQNSKLHISKPIKSKFDGKMVITLSRRVPTSDNSFRGIVYAVIDLNYFHSLISEVDVGKSGNISLISIDDGILLYRHPMNTANLGQKIIFESETNRLIQSQLTSGEWSQNSFVDKKKKTFAFRLNRDFNYLVATGLAEEDFLSQWYLSLLTALFVVAAFVVSLIWGLVKYIKYLEQNEMQKNRIHEISRKDAIARIATGVAHEINNPLAIIKGKSEIARMIIEDSKICNPDLSNKLFDIEKMVIRIANTIKGLQILEQSVVDENKAYKLEELILPAIEVWSQRMLDNSIDLNLEIIPELLVDCNRAEIIEVFVHLLSNAVDAVKNLEKKWISIAFEKRDKNIIIKITDSGTGITKKDAIQLTDPFYTTKQPGSGTGLGLSVSDAILRNHGGSLSCNINSKNTQFIIVLKIMKPDMAVA